MWPVEESNMAFKSDEAHRAYMRQYNKGWYQKHRERLREKRKQHDEELKQWLKRYKSQFCCKLCGEKHPACLQFHHRDKNEKSFNIGSTIGRWRYISFKKLVAEVSKCDILCGNCHAILHWREIHEFDSWLDILTPVDQV